MNTVVLYSATLCFIIPSPSHKQIQVSSKRPPGLYRRSNVREVVRIRVNEMQPGGLERKGTCGVECHGRALGSPAACRRRCCREEITMLGGWEAGIDLLPGEGWTSRGFGAPLPSPSPFSHSDSVSPSLHTGALLLSVLLPEFNQPVSSRRLNQSLPPLISDQHTARMCRCPRCTLMMCCTVPLFTVLHRRI